VSATAFVTPDVRRAAAGADTWQADVVPFPAAFRDEPAARPGVVLVTAGDSILASDIRLRAPAEVVDVADILAAALRTAARAVDAWPREVEVRHREVAEALAARLAGEDVRVVRRPRLPDLDRVAAAMAADVAGWRGGGRPASSPETWAGWRLPDPVVADLFRGAASLWRAAPWVWLRNERLLTAEVPGGRSWLASLLGYGGQEFGLVLYESRRDFQAVLSEPRPGQALGSLEDRVLALTFTRRGELPRRMQREVASRGWEVAAPEAYPLLMALNTPGGGASRRDAADLAAVLGAVAALAGRFTERLAGSEAVDWRDPATGVVLGIEAVDGASRRPSPWSAPGSLAPSGPEGPGARPEAALGAPWAGEAAALEAFAEALGSAAVPFEAWLREERGLSGATARKHGDNAATFLVFLSDYELVPLASLTEYDLRVFLFDWYIRKVADPAYRARAMPASLGHFFDWLGQERGIGCPWAETVLGEREAFDARRADFPGGPWWDEGVRAWQDELTEDLDARVLLHDPGLGTSALWGEEGPMGLTMGVVEAGLDRELGRRWLLWRDEEIRGGTIDPARLRAALLSRQRGWEGTARPDLDGRTPAGAIKEERAERREREDDPTR